MEESVGVAEKGRDVQSIDGQNVDTGVKWSIINNKRYFDRLREIVGKRTVGKTLARSVLHTLQHRGGTKGEDLYLIDARSGVLADKNISSKHELGVEKTARMEKILSAQDDKQYIIFHNHPLSSPPSVADLNSLYKNKKIIFGVIVGHDGTIYKYTAPKKPIVDNALKVAIIKFSSIGYSTETATEMAYECIKEEYGFELEVYRNE